MKFKQLALPAAMAVALLTSACGGGGSSSASSTNTTVNDSSSRITGAVAKGVMQHGLVIVSEWVNGKWIERAETQTDDAGGYSVQLSRYQQGPVKVSAVALGATRMKCDAEFCGSVPFGDAVDISVSGQLAPPTKEARVYINAVALSMRGLSDHACR